MATFSDSDLLELAQFELGRMEPSVDISQLDMTTSITSLGIESITLIEFVSAIEERYDIIIPDDELTEIDNLAALGSIARRHLAADV